MTKCAAGWRSSRGSSVTKGASNAAGRSGKAVAVKRLKARPRSGYAPIRTPSGDTAIVAGDAILSRSEYDVNGPVVVRVVEEVFKRWGRVWHLWVGGQRIRTTGEHPFFERERGWVACELLREGDWLATEDGRWVRVERVEDTGASEVVYNLRVSEDHTYFVGASEWGFSVWSHNRYDIREDGTVLHNPELNRQETLFVYQRLRQLGLDVLEASGLAILGADVHTDGRVLLRELRSGQMARMVSRTLGNDQARASGVGELIRLMTRPARGFNWSAAVRIEPSGATGRLGWTYRIPLDGNPEVGVLAWRPRNAADRAHICHGLSSGGVDAPNGPFSPYSFTGIDSTILNDQGFILALRGRVYTHHDDIQSARPGDLLVWGKVPSTPDAIVEIDHSAVLTHLRRVIDRGATVFHRYDTFLQTKNGLRGDPVNLSLYDINLGRVDKGRPCG